MSLIRGAVMVIAKTPVAGRVKTRLCPPLTAEEACEVAWAALLDTLDAAAAVPSERHVLVLHGEPGPWIPAGFEIIEQRGVGLAERLANAFTDVNDDAIVVAMDTPQVRADQLADSLGSLADHDAAYGPATDGGYWLIGLRRSVDPVAAFHGIPMSTPHTGAAQLARLASLGVTVNSSEALQDIDTYDDLVAVSAVANSSRLTTVVRHADLRRALEHSATTV